MIKHRTITVSGVLIGRLWMPGVISWKHVSARIERTKDRYFVHGGPYPDLRTALVSLLNDGDFQETGFAPDALRIEVEDFRVRGSSTIETRTRVWEIRGTCWETDDVYASGRLLEEWDEAGGLDLTYDE